LTYDELRQALSVLPQDVTEPNGVPRVLAARLSPQERVARRRLNLPQVEYRLLAGLAMSGWSFRYGLIEAVAALHGQVPHSGTFVRANAHLVKAGLWQVTTVRLTVAVSLVQLTALGKELMAEIVVTPVLSEWEQMQQRHRGGQGQRHHSAAVCLFAYHARLRGYRVLLCPYAPGGAEPDLLIERDDESLYVEVQGRGGEVWQRADKWWSAYHVQGEAAICTLTPAQAVRYAREAQRVGVRRGRVTDLHTRYRSAPSSLWTHEWQSQYGGLLPIVDHTKGEDNEQCASVNICATSK